MCKIGRSRLGWFGQKPKPYLKNNQRKKGLQTWLKWENACLAISKSWVQNPVLKWNVLLTFWTLSKSIILIHLVIVFFNFWQDWGLNSELHTCKADTLLLDPHFLFISRCLFWRWGISQTISLGWPRTLILPISASQVAMIIGVSHQHLDYFFKKNH
jgi:hypothetical protein